MLPLADRHHRQALKNRLGSSCIVVMGAAFGCCLLLIATAMISWNILSARLTH